MIISINNLDCSRLFQQHRVCNNSKYTANLLVVQRNINFNCWVAVDSGENNLTHMPVTICVMMASWNGNIFRVPGHLCAEFTGHRWIPLRKASDAELWCFFDLRLNKRLSKHSWGWWFETPSRLLWHHYNGSHTVTGLNVIRYWTGGGPCTHCTFIVERGLIYSSDIMYITTILLPIHYFASKMLFHHW